MLKPELLMATCPRGLSGGAPADGAREAGGLGAGLRASAIISAAGGTRYEAGTDSKEGQAGPAAPACCCVLGQEF